MKQTFKDLGIPFPLFEASIKEASSYCGKDRCVLCQTEKEHTFSVKIL